MTTVIKLKRGTSTPTTSNIVSGEIAVDTSAQKLYINDASTIKTIGLGNPAVSDISDLTATATELNYTDGVTSNIQTQLNAKSPTASPTFTGTPAAPTASAGTNTTQIATTSFVSTAVSNLVDSAPGTLNTLNELAAALGDDANFSTTVTNSIATKLPLAGGTMSGVIAGFESTGIDDNASSTALTLDSSGNVGIGQTSPSRLLEVLKSGVDDVNIAVIGGGSGAGGASVAIGASGTSSYIRGVNNGVGAYVPLNVGGSITVFETSASERMRIDSSGRVGIGTSSPSYLTHLYSTSSEPKLVIEDASSGAGRGGVVTGTWGGNGIRLDSLGAAGWVYVGGSNTSYIPFTIGTEKARFHSNGNFGLGTTNPSYKLHVVGDINYTGTLYNNGVASGSPAQVLIKNSSGTTIKVRVGLNAGGTTTNIKNSAGTALKTAVGPFVSGDAGF